MKYDAMREYEKSIAEIEEEGRRYRENIRRHFMDLLRDISCGSDSVHHQESGINQAGMATGESRSASRNGAEGAGETESKGNY
jgi:hypothetical protein